MDELSTLVDVFCSSDEAWTEEDTVASFVSSEEEEVAIVVESIVVSELLLSTDIFSVEEVDEDVEVLIVFKEDRFIFDSDDDFVSFREVATLVCLVSCLAELFLDPDLARDVVFVVATVFLELLPGATVEEAGGLLF